MARLVRTTAGTTVHRVGCATIDITNGIPWLWAEHRGPDEVRRAIAMVGSRACTVCKPVAQ